jgi:hypothetical protein
MVRTISQSVGRGGANVAGDVRVVQELINVHIASLTPLRPVFVDGRIGPGTIQAIEEFQRRIVRMPIPDGRVDPRGATLTALQRARAASAIAAPAFNFAGKSFEERKNAFLADVLARYGLTVREAAFARNEGDAQRWHIAHMFYYNSFEYQKPKKCEPENGRNVIKWDHISKATLVWEHGVDWTYFLRDASDQVPVKTPDGNGWVAGRIPDRTMSKKRAFAILQSNGIATSEANKPHGAMVAPGYQRCGEPCACGGNQSKHIARKACDLNKHDYPKLEQKLLAERAGSLDDYLKKFGLKRPMMVGKNAEPWHIEATTP